MWFSFLKYKNLLSWSVRYEVWTLLLKTRQIEMIDAFLLSEILCCSSFWQPDQFLPFSINALMAICVGIFVFGLGSAESIIVAHMARNPAEEDIMLANI